MRMYACAACMCIVRASAACMCACMCTCVCMCVHVLLARSFCGSFVRLSVCVCACMRDGGNGGGWVGGEGGHARLCTFMDALLYTCSQVVFLR